MNARISTDLWDFYIAAQLALGPPPKNMSVNPNSLSVQADHVGLAYFDSFVEFARKAGVVMHEQYYDQRQTERRIFADFLWVYHIGRLEKYAKGIH